MGDTNELKDYLKTFHLSNVKFISVNPCFFAKFLNFPNKIGIFKYSFYLSFKVWHYQVYKLVKKLVKDSDYDFIHYLTPIGFREPGYLWKLDLPYIWGPIGGTYSTSLKLTYSISFSQFSKTLLRHIVNSVQLTLNIRIRKALKRSKYVIAATKYDQLKLAKISKRFVDYIPENSITSSNPSILNRNNDGVVNLIWVGRIDSNKSLHLLLKSLKNLVNENFKLFVVGEGPLKHKCTTLVRSLGLADKVQFYGKISRVEVFNLFAISDVHIITSLSEANTTVLWEAMSYFVPTISLNHCGMSDVLCGKCGVKIDLRSENEVVSDLELELKKFINNKSYREGFKISMIECIRDYSHYSIMNKWRKLYESIR
jgi:glycosyltransferase involved in cell wall biosynthesis